jgi:gliding motility-associated-like protein
MKIFLSVISFFFFSIQLYSQCTPIIATNPINTLGCEVLTIQFSDNSICTVQQRLWDFGDGSTTSVQNPTHGFSAGVLGDTTYIVLLQLLDFNGVWHTADVQVDVYKEPLVSFNQTTLVTCVLIDAVQFTNTSPMPAGNSLVWNFGDGSPTSTVANPSHTYTSTGSFSVSLTVTNVRGCSRTLSKNIVVNEIPNPNFLLSTTVGCDPLPVSVTNTTIEGVFPVSSWSWNFGGQASSSDEDPLGHTFVGEGVYQVGLTATNTAGCTNTTTTNLLVKKTPISTFSIPAEICLGDTLDVLYTGDGLPGSNYSWGFGSPIYTSGSGQGPIRVLWNQDGLQNVSLTVTEDGCSSSTTESLIVHSLPVVSLVSDELDNSICDGDIITFSALPNGYVTYDFLNMGSSIQNTISSLLTLSNLSAPNSMTVIATDENGCNSAPSNAIVTNVVSKPVVNLSVSDAINCEGQSVVFTADGAFDRYTFNSGFLTYQSGNSNVYTTDSLGNGRTVTVFATHNGCDGDLSNAIVVTIVDSLDRPIANCGVSTNNSVQIVWGDNPEVTSYQISIDGGAFYEPASRNEETITGLNFGDIVSVSVQGLGPLPCGNTFVSELVQCIAQPCEAISFSITEPLTYCEGDTVRLRIDNIQTPSDEFGIVWNGETPVKDSTFWFIASQDQVVNVYLVDSTQITCPSYTHNYIVNVNPLPNSTILSAVVDLCFGESYAFESSFFGYANYQFFVDDVLMQDSDNPVFTYASFPSGASSLVLHTTELSCVSHDTLELNIIPIQDIDLFASDTVCIGSVIDYSATNGYQYYTFFNSLNNSILVDSTINTFSSSLYNNVTVIATDEFGCRTNPADKIVESWALPEVVLTSSIIGNQVCEGDEMTLTASSATAMIIEFWDNYQLLQSGTETTIDISTISNGNYYAARGIFNGCIGSFSDSLIYVVSDSLAKPIVNCGTSGDGQMEFYWTNVNGANGYQVRVDGGAFVTPSSGALGLNHLVTGLTPTSEVFLNVVAIGSAPCGNSVVSDTVYCVMNCSPISITTNGSVFNICEEQSVNLVVTDIVTGSADFNLSWDGNTIQNSLSQTFAPAQDTLVVISVTDPNQSWCTPTTFQFSVNVNPLPNVVLSGNTSFCSTDIATFTASPANYDNYQFFERVTAVANGMNPSYTVNELEDGYFYSVVASHNGCTDTSNVITIAVSDAPEKPNLICGSSTTNSVSFMWDAVSEANGFEISVNGFPYQTPSSGVGGLLHLENGLNEGDVLVAKVRAIGTNPCLYGEESDLVSCSAINCALVNFTAPANQEICEGSTLNLEVLNIQTPSSQYAISWDGGLNYSLATTFSTSVVNDSLIHIIVRDSSQMSCPLIQKEVAVEVNQIPVFVLNTNANANSICLGSSLDITASVQGYDNYDFYIDGVSVQNSLNNSYSTSELSVGMYSIHVIAMNQSCSFQSPNTNITVVETPSLIFSSSDDNDTICAGTSLVFSAINGFDNYDFYLNNTLVQSSVNEIYNLVTPVNGDEVYVIASANTICEQTSSIIKTRVLANPVYTLSTDVGSVICSGTNVNFTISPIPTTYDLYNTSTLLGSFTGNSFSMDDLETIDSIYIEGSFYGCLGYSDTIQLTVELTPTLTLASDTVRICIGDQALLTAQGGTSYAWSTTENTENISVQPNTTTTYYVNAILGNCSSSQDSIVVWVETDVPSAFIGDDLQICRYESVELTATGGSNYQWLNTQAISNVNIANPIVNPIEDTEYLVVVSNVVCFDTAQIMVFVDRCLTNLPAPVPQIITPNNDGSNDALVIDDIDYFENAKLTIYNRWSNLVYEASPYNNDWRGTTTSGKELPDGTYFIVVDLGNGSTPYTGYVMIQR